MNFNVLDTESTYRKLLATPDADEREAIFKTELAEPFAGIARVFGMNDVMAAFKMWRMSPEQFAGEQGERTARIVDNLASHDAFNRAAQSLQVGWDAFAPYQDRVKMDAVTFGLMVADLEGAPGGAKYTGFGGIPGWIMTVYGDATEFEFKRVEACTVHELHHNLGGSAGAVFGNMQTITVGEYMIGEGLAESYAAELYGEDTIGPWVIDFDEAQLAHTKSIFRDGLNASGFDLVRSYIFGGAVQQQMGLPPIDVPPFAGYALGYRVVQAYLKRTGKRVADATFVPAAELIAESGFFED